MFAVRPLALLLLAAILVFAACTVKVSAPTTTPGAFAAATATTKSGPQPYHTPAPTPAPASGMPSFSHVFVIIMENEEASSVLNSSSAPYVNKLASQYALASHYYAVSHPSLPNYISLTSGKSAPFDGTDCVVSSSCHVPGTNTNIADEIEASGRTWGAYMEGMPSPCAQQNSGLYVVRHNPFVYYDDIRTGGQNRCASHDVVYDQTSFDAILTSNQVPNFVWITPNLCDDGHNRCNGDPVAHSDAWLAQNVPPILASAAFQQGGVLFITWDEGKSGASCCGLSGGGGQMVTLVISPMGHHGFQSSVSYDHYSLLRTIEDSWHLGLLNDTNPATLSGTSDMSGFFA